MSFLGIDLGTSGVRLLLVDGEGAPLASASRPCAGTNPFPGWSEQNPSDWIAALEGAVAELREACPDFADLRGIGVSGHMHGATLLDARGKVLRPCILWNDTRSHAEAAMLDRVPDMRRLSGNIVFPGFTAPKLEWVRRHEPDIFDATAKVLLPAGFLNHWLTGEYVADLSDSAGTSWLDVGARRWSERLLELSRMRGAQMPRLTEGTLPAGQLKGDLAARWGVRPDVVVAAGAGDNAAAACGIGALHEGQGFVSLGTSGVVLLARDGCHPAPDTAVHTFCHAIPDSWYQMSVMLSATDSLNWLSRIVGQPPASLTASLGNTLRGPGGELFLPYLSGERTPHNDAAVRGNLSGLSLGTDRDDLTRAVLEGVAFGLRAGRDALAATGARADMLYVIGGGAASDYWVRLLATVLDTELQRPDGGEFGAALGAARLGMAAATGHQASDIMHPPGKAERFLPDPALRDAFEATYTRFQKAYDPVRRLS